MIAAARRRMPEGSAAVAFRVVAFEDLAAEDGSFDLIVFADAFHWVDPEARFSRSARLLRPGGWLAVLSLEQVYDEPLMTTLRQMWVDRSDDGGMWLRRPGLTRAQAIDASGHFASPLKTSFCARRSRSASEVVNLESTRATALSWTDDDRRAFIEELRGGLCSSPVDLTEVAHITMAQAVHRRP